MERAIFEYLKPAHYSYFYGHFEAGYFHFLRIGNRKIIIGMYVFKKFCLENGSL